MNATSKPQASESEPTPKSTSDWATQFGEVTRADRPADIAGLSRACDNPNDHIAAFRRSQGRRQSEIDMRNTLTDSIAARFEPSIEGTATKQPVEMDALKKFRSCFRSQMTVRSASRPTSASTMSTCSGGSMDMKEQNRHFRQESDKNNEFDAAAALQWNDAKNTAHADLEKDGKNLDVEHGSQAKQTERQFAYDVAEFLKHWSQRFTEFDARQADTLLVFQENQKRLHAEYMERARADVSFQPKWSPECLRLLRSSQTLRKQGSYVEAKLRLEKADALKIVEQQVWSQNCETKIAALEAGFLKKQSRCAAAFEEKQAAERRQILLRQKDQRSRLECKHAKHARNDMSQRKIATSLHAQRVKAARYGRYGAAVCPDLRAGHFRPNWKGVKSDAPLRHYASPEYV